MEPISSEKPPIMMNPALPLPDDFVPGESNFIQVKEFKFFYGKKEALHGINLEIPSRKVTAFIGPSGCGIKLHKISKIEEGREF